MLSVLSRPNIATSVNAADATTGTPEVRSLGPRTKEQVLINFPIDHGG